jgi:Protein of unknown function (DUF3558)
MIRIRPVLLVASLALVLSGCAATSVVGTAGPEGSSVTSAEAAAGEAAGGGSGPAFDACSLVPAADVQALIGANDGGVAADPVGTGGNCVWTNKDNEYSVSVDIGATDTAINGLPELDPALGTAEPLEDGMRYFAGAVEFEAKGRSCSVQVATNNTADGGDKGAAVELAKKVKSRV